MGRYEISYLPIFMVVTVLIDLYGRRLMTLSKSFNIAVTFTISIFVTLLTVSPLLAQEYDPALLIPETDQNTVQVTQSQPVVSKETQKQKDKVAKAAAKLEKKRMKAVVDKEKKRLKAIADKANKAKKLKEKQERAIKKAADKKLANMKKAAKKKAKAEKKIAEDKAQHEKEASDTLRRVEELLAKIGNETDGDHIKKYDGQISDYKADIIEYFGKGHTYYPGLALLDARVKAAKRDHKNLTDTWVDALKALQRQMTPTQLQKLNAEVGRRAAEMGMLKESEYFYNAAGSYSDTLSSTPKVQKFEFKTEQLRALAPSMDWEQLREALEIYREDAAFAFEITQYGRFISILTDTELHFTYSPEGEDKRNIMSAKLKEVDLHSRIHDQTMPRDMKRRLRGLRKEIQMEYSLGLYREKPKKKSKFLGVF